MPDINFIKEVVERAFDPFSELPAIYAKKEKMVDEYIEKSRKAQEIVATFTQEQVDKLVKAMAVTIYEHAEELGKMAAEETGMGDPEHKVTKNIGKSTGTWAELKGKPSIGVIREEPENGVIVLAKPMGVLGCVTPTTNPTITPLVNGMCAVKCANSLVVSPHPRAKNTTMKTVELMNEAIIAAGGPADLVQCIDQPDVDVSGLLMKKVDVVLATGGPDMVKAAYSSGKPAFGVGAGNSQSIVDRGIDFDEAAADIIEGRTFDLGVICAGNQCIHVHEEDYAAMKAACEKAGAYWADDAAEVEKLRNTLFINGVLNKEVIGQVPATMGKMAGIAIPEDRSAIIIKASGTDDVLCKEKLTTAIAVMTYKTFDEAVENACTNTYREGAGHSAVVYSDNDDNILAAAKKLPVGRILVNQPGHAAGGDARFNGLEGTVSLGCGSWGGNSISENLTYHHLMNVSRIAYRHPMPGCDATPEEIFAD